MKHDSHALRSALAQMKTGLRLLATPETVARLTAEEHLELVGSLLKSHSLLQEFVESVLKEHQQ